MTLRTKARPNFKTTRYLYNFFLQPKLKMLPLYTLRELTTEKLERAPLSVSSGRGIIYFLG